MKLKKLLMVWTALFTICSMMIPASGYSITAKKEEELSREFLKFALQYFEIIDDHLIVDYVDSIGQKIVSALPPQPFEYHFYVIKQDEFNAFASPAGHIFINSGLVIAMESEAELAGILGHEVSHVKCRHLSDMIKKSKKTGLATIVGIAAGIFLGIGGASEIANAITIGSIAAGQAMSLAYSRDNEIQADQVGLKYLTRVGYDVEGLLIILKKIRNKTWFTPNQIPTYLQTHPATDDRIAYIGSYLERHKKDSPDIKKGTDEFDVIHTRLVALYGDQSAAIRKFKTALEKQPKDPVANYGYGLTLARAGNRKEGISRLKTVVGDKFFDPYILQAIGKIYFLDGQYKEALKILEGAVNNSTYTPECQFYLGRTMMELDRLKDAADVFNNLLIKKPDYLEARYSLGETYHKLEMSGDAHYHLGLFYKSKREPENAAFHLSRALKETKEPERKKKIEELLNKIEKKIKNDKISGQGGPQTSRKSRSRITP
jgi:predicted Zn-dependent protease